MFVEYLKHAVLSHARFRQFWTKWFSHSLRLLSRDEMREMWNKGEIMGYCLRPERAFANGHQLSSTPRDFWLHFERQLPIGAFFIRFSKSRPGYISASSYRGEGRWDAGNNLWDAKALDADNLLQVGQCWIEFKYF